MSMQSYEMTEQKIVKALEIVKQYPHITMKDLSSLLSASKSQNLCRTWATRNTHNWNTRYAAALKEAFNNLEGPAIQVMSNLIKDNNFQAAKYVLDNRDYGAAQKVKADVNADVVIDVSVDENA